MTDSSPDGGSPRVRVDDVLAADVRAGGREREVVRLDDRGDPVGLQRVLDARCASAGSGSAAPRIRMSPPALIE